MKLILFGATGGTGQQLVTQALAQGHEVTAFSRSPEKLNLKHQRLSLLQGDVLELNAVKKAVKNKDAIICALGSSAFDKSKLRTQGTQNILKAMQANDIKRLICLSAHGVGDSYDSLPWHYKGLILPLFLRHVMADHLQQESAIKNSSVDWTIIRAANLTNGEQTGWYKYGATVMDNTSKLKISRADVAEFMLKQLSDPSNIHKTPSISY